MIEVLIHTAAFIVFMSATWQNQAMADAVNGTALKIKQIPCSALTQDKVVHMQINAQEPEGAWGIRYLDWGSEEFQALERRAAECPLASSNLSLQQQVDLVRQQMEPAVLIARRQRDNYERLSMAKKEILSTTSDDDHSIPEYYNIKNLLERIAEADLTYEKKSELQFPLTSRLQHIGVKLHADQRAAQERATAEDAKQSAAQEEQREAEIKAQKRAMAERQARSDQQLKTLEEEAKRDSDRDEAEFKRRPECQKAVATQKEELPTESGNRLDSILINFMAGSKDKGCAGLAKLLDSLERVRSDWADCSPTAAIQFNEMRKTASALGRDQGCDVP